MHLFILAVVCVGGLQVLLRTPEARAIDEHRRRAERRARGGDPSAVVECIRIALRAELPLDPTWLAQGEYADLMAAGVVVARKGPRPPRLSYLNQIDARWREAAEWWFNPTARDAPRFVTTTGDVWIKEFRAETTTGQEPIEIWRVKVDYNRGRPGAAPDEGTMLLGPVIGRMNHHQALELNSAFQDLYGLVTPEGRWPEALNTPAKVEAKLREILKARKFSDETATAVIRATGGNIEPVKVADMKDGYGWHVPYQDTLPRTPPTPENPEGQVDHWSHEEWGPRNEWSVLFRHGALEVGPSFQGRWFWSASVSPRYSNNAHEFSGGYGYLDSGSRNFVYHSVRLVARVR